MGSQHMSLAFEFPNEKAVVRRQSDSAWGSSGGHRSATATAAACPSSSGSSCSLSVQRAGAFGAALAGGLLAIDARTGRGGLAGLVNPLFMFVSTTGFIVANSIAGALGTCPERAGAVSALVGTAQYGTGILGSALVGYFADGTPWTMAWVIAAFGAGTLFCTLFLVPTNTLVSDKIADK